MLIKFKKPDPRAGLVVQMDSSLGQQMIDKGAAVAHKEGAEEAPAAAAPAPAAKTVAPVTTKTVPASKRKA